MKINAVIIGAGRSGTTTLYQYLENHRDVCFSDIKEVHYFSVDELYERGESYYHSFWKHCKNEDVMIAADTYLLIDKKAPRRIAEYNSDMKIIIMLRNPSERTWSSFQYALNNGYISKNKSFIQSVQEEEYHIGHSDITVQNNLCNLWQSKYFEHISYWSEFFPRDNMLFLKTYDLKNNTSYLLNQLSVFLNIDNFKVEDTTIKANKSAKAKSKILQQFLLNRNNPLRVALRKILPDKIKQRILHSKLPEKLSSVNRKEKSYPPISEEDRKYITELLQKDQERLERVFGINL
ncbi:MAG: sulfotransferase domain-containing protein [Chlorobi bacterium]|nr:sulfotransferase domain-containing protein [Chlorobiota bacterium]